MEVTQAENSTTHALFSLTFTEIRENYTSLKAIVHTTAFIKQFSIKSQVSYYK